MGLISGFLERSREKEGRKDDGAKWANFGKTLNRIGCQLSTLR
jgi:hypothetical protein